MRDGLCSMYSSLPSWQSHRSKPHKHVEDGLCVDLYDPKNTGDAAPDIVAIAICGGTESACGTSGDSPGAKNPYYCEDCDTVTIYEFSFSKSQGTVSPTCQAVFTFPEDYGDVYYNSDGHLYDAFGKWNPARIPFASPPLTAAHQGTKLAMCLVSTRFKVNS